MRFQQPPQFQFAVRFHDCVGIDGEIDGDAAHRGKLIAGAKGPGGHRGLNLVDKLAIDRDAAMGVEAEDKFGCGALEGLLHSINVLVD